MSWIKANISYPEGWQLGRTIDGKRMPLFFTSNVIADMSGKTYSCKDVEWFDEDSNQRLMIDMVSFLIEKIISTNILSKNDIIEMCNNPDNE